MLNYNYKVSKGRSRGLRPLFLGYMSKALDALDPVP